ncbi:hypothetical protein [Anaerosporobacter sp.]|uniref:hypothetical protein n=1 Tax=Anaerosporobacter sp. TaxID=1872529 RepID=UPI00286F63AC|nr:hypothetical protein [Anaerosporobacter sp.]
MKSICYAVLPDSLILDNDIVYAFVKNHIAKYYSELEVEPYKEYFSEKRTWEIARENGFNSLIDFEEHLKTHKDEDGIENGLYYWSSNFNTQGRWDGIRLDGIKKCSNYLCSLIGKENGLLENGTIFLWDEPEENLLIEWKISERIILCLLILNCWTKYIICEVMPCQIYFK